MAIVSIQRGETTLNSATAVNQSITAVTMANAWVNVLGVRSDDFGGSAAWGRQLVDAQLTSTTNISFKNAVGPDGITIRVEWEVIEDDELSVQRGQITAPTNNPGTNNVTITAVDLSCTWTCTWATGDDGTSTNNYFFVPTVRLSSTTNLQFVHDSSVSSARWSWQVIEDTGGRFSVQRLNGTLGTGTTVNVTISSVTLAHSWIRFYAFESGSAVANDADEVVNGFLQSTTNLRFERLTTASGSFDYTAEVIESTQADVQRGQLVFGTNSVVNSTISNVDTATTFVMMGQSYTAVEIANSGNILNGDINTTSLTSTTNIQGERKRGTSNSVQSRFEVISEALPPLTTQLRKIRVNPVRPVLQKNHPLANGLVFSCCFGWVKGFRANENEDLAMDDRTKRRGDIQGSKAGTFGVNQAGRQINGGVSDDRSQWENGPNNQLGDIDTVFGTVMMVFQPDRDDAGTEAGIFSKRANGNPASEGWSINTDLSNGTDYEFEYSDGVSNADSNSDTNAPLNMRYPQILAGRFKGTNDADEFVDLWMDGRRRGIQTTVDPTGTPTNFLDVEVFGYQSQDGLFGEANMGAVYNRLMPVSAVQQHMVDPYDMWRSREHRRFFEGPGGIVGAYQTYFLAF